MSAHSDWTVASWLASTKVNEDIARAVLSSSSARDCPTQLSFIQTIGGYQPLLELLQHCGVLEALAASMWSAIEELMAASAATPAELQAKFLQSGMGMLSYTGLSTFFGGLEGQIGPPNSKVDDAMSHEHTMRDEAEESFTTPNYSIVTTPAIEWAFVATPEKKPPQGWPMEKKLLAAEFVRGVHAAEGYEAGSKLLESGAKRRKPMPVLEMELRRRTKNLALEQLGEPLLERAELIAARLYTGPMFVKYNAVLRGLNSSVLFFRSEMIRLCSSPAAADKYAKAVGEAKAERLRESPSFDERKPTELDEQALKTALKPAYENARGQINTYATSLHAINSSIVKLGKLTEATKVFRGIGGKTLPDQFMTPNEYGVKGGIEAAFMSTTRDREVAMRYASGGSGIIFEVQQGMVDRGADIRFISQYPHEQEIVFGPLTGLEVRTMRVDGHVLVIDMALSVNLASLTIDQVIGRRKKMLRDMLPGLQLELQDQTKRDGATPEGAEHLARRLVERCEAGPLANDIEWFNDDEHLLDALKDLLNTRRGMAQGGEIRMEEIKRLDAQTREQYQIPYSAPAPRSEEKEPLLLGFTKNKYEDGSSLQCVWWTLRRLRMSLHRLAPKRGVPYASRRLCWVNGGRMVVLGPPAIPPPAPTDFAPTYESNAAPKRFHLFLSYSWATGQDQMRIVKQRLLEMIPDVHVFLDLDDLKGATGRGADYVDASSAVLAFCSQGYLESHSCLRELLRAVLTSKPIIAVLETDQRQGRMTKEQIFRGIKDATTRLRPLEKEVKSWGYELPSAETLHAALFASEPIEWNRITHFQDVTMRLIAQRMLSSSRRTFVPGELSQLKPSMLPTPRGGATFHVYCSTDNLGAAELMREVNHHFDGKLRLELTESINDVHNSERMLVYLTARTWTSGEASAAFADEVRDAMNRRMPLLLCHENADIYGSEGRFGCEFGHLIDETPKDLLRDGIFTSIATPLKGGEWRRASMAMLAQELAAPLEGSGNEVRSPASRTMRRWKRRRGRAVLRAPPGHDAGS